MDIKFTNLYKTLDEYCKEFSKLYKDKLRSRGHTGLMNNFSCNFEIFNNTYKITISLPDYYYWVENGRKPGKFPPVVAIQKWIKQKHLPTGNGKKLPTLNQLAFLIGRKIAREGTKGTHDLQITQETIDRIYQNKIKEAIQQDINIFEEQVKDTIYMRLKDIGMF